MTLCEMGSMRRDSRRLRPRCQPEARCRGAPSAAGPDQGAVVRVSGLIDDRRCDDLAAPLVNLSLGREGHYR